MDYKINYQAALQRIKDMAITEFMISLAPDDETKQLIGTTMDIFTKNGIPVDVAMKIVIELGNIFNKKENE